MAALNVAVSGASGFIGHHVIESLERAGFEPTLWLRPTSSRPVSSRHRIVRMDVRDPPKDAFAILGRPDVLIHLAWDGLPNYHSPHHLELELPAHRSLLEQLLRAGLETLLVAGSCSEYGLQSGALDETSPSSPVTSYALAKDSLRGQLQRLQAEMPFGLTWARLFYLYGEGQAQASLWSQLRGVVQAGLPTFAMSGGEQIRDYMPVERAADALVALAIQRRDHGIVNVCSGRPTSVREVVDGWITANGWSVNLDLGRLPYPTHEPMAFWGDETKLRRCLESA